MRIAADDEIYRVNTVWLGPTGIDVPWTARYQAYALWLLLFLAALLFEAVTPLRVHVPPIWEACAATLATYSLMTFVDHERPIGSIWKTFIADLMAPRRPKAAVYAYRVRITQYMRVIGRIRKVIR